MAEKEENAIILGGGLPAAEEDTPAEIMGWKPRRSLKYSLKHLTDRQKRVIRCTREVGFAAPACEMARVPYATHRTALRTSPNYKQAFEIAREGFFADLERESVRRAVVGTKKPIYQKGKLVGVELKPSDALMMFLLKGNVDKYRDKDTSVVVNNMNASMQNNIDIKSMSPAEQNEFARETFERLKQFGVGGPEKDVV